jgi:transcriptional regulator with XRE-family HTH domain
MSVLSGGLRMAVDIDVKIGLNLRRLRERRRMSMEDLSRAVGITPDQLKKWEAGEARIGSMSVFAAAETLDADLNEFFR